MNGTHHRYQASLVQGGQLRQTRATFCITMYKLELEQTQGLELEPKLELEQKRKLELEQETPSVKCKSKVAKPSRDELESKGRGIKFGDD
jgi:hypothetical protein